MKSWMQPLTHPMTHFVWKTRNGTWKCFPAHLMPGSVWLRALPPCCPHPESLFLQIFQSPPIAEAPSHLRCNMGHGLSRRVGCDYFHTSAVNDDEWPEWTVSLLSQSHEGSLGLRIKCSLIFAFTVVSSSEPCAHRTVQGLRYLLLH